MVDQADSVYFRGHPWASNEERLVTEALGATAGMSVEQIQAIRPPIPRVQLFPPRFGYEKKTIGIEDVLDINRSYPGARVDYAGNKSGQEGSTAPSLGVM
jgi:hypothetical protein